MRLQRRDVTFQSDSNLCHAWLYLPPQSESSPQPCIVMAHGLGGTRDAGLEPYARKFAEAGYVVLVFDYRHIGASEGKPRQLFSVKRQLQDWACAIAYVRTLPYVEPAKVALWGTSFSGGHVIVAAARDGKIAAVSAQGPMMDAFVALHKYLSYAGFGAFLKLGVLGMLDQVRAGLGGSPVYVPLAAKPGQLAAMSSPDALPGYRAITPPHWQNEVCARYALTVATYRPVAYARKIRCPTLIQVCLHDDIAPPQAARATALKTTKAKLTEYACRHFDIYVGKNFERASREQLTFFDTVMRNQARSL